MASDPLAPIRDRLRRQVADQADLVVTHLKAGNLGSAHAIHQRASNLVWDCHGLGLIDAPAANVLVAILHDAVAACVQRRPKWPKGSS